MVKRALDGMARVYDGMQRFSTWCAALGFLAGGIALYVGPGEIAKELPAHREVGIGCIVFAVVFLLALGFDKSESRAGRSVGYRTKSLLGCMVCVLIAGAIGWVMVPKIKQASLLSQDGRVTQAAVVHTRSTLRKGRLQSQALVSYANQRKWVDTPRRMRKGERVPMLYLPSDPKVSRARSTRGEFMDILDMSTWVLAGIGLALLGTVLGAFATLKGFLAGPPRDPALNES